MWLYRRWWVNEAIPSDVLKVVGQMILEAHSTISIQNMRLFTQVGKDVPRPGGHP